MQQNTGSDKKIFFQATGLMTLVIFLGYPLGYVRDMLVTRQFGAGIETDAWITASLIPDLCSRFLMIGALGVSFIPVFAEYLMQKKEKEAWEVACTVINVTTLFLGLIMLVGIIGAPVLVKIFAPGFSQAARLLTIQLTRIILPVVLFAGVTGLLTGIYRAYLRFTIPALVNFLNPAILIVFIILFSHSMGIFVLAYGTLLATFLSLLILIFFFFIRRPPYTFTFNLKHPAIKEILFLMVPLIGADILNSSGVLVSRIFASFLTQGSITAFSLANRIVLIPVLIFSSAVVSPILPLLSLQKAKGEKAEFKDTILWGVRLIGLLFPPVMVGFMVMCNPLVRILFERGRFDALATANTATVLFYLSFGLLAYGINPILYQVCYALKKNWYLFLYEIIGLVITIPLSYLFIKLMGLPGLALVAVIARIILVAYLFRVLNRHLGGLALRSLWPFCYKILTAAVLMGGVCYLGYGFLNNFFGSSRLFDQIIRLVGATVLAAVSYFSFLFLFKVEELMKMKEIIFKKQLKAA